MYLLPYHTLHLSPTHSPTGMSAILPWSRLEPASLWVYMYVFNDNGSYISVRLTHRHTPSPPLPPHKTNLSTINPLTIQRASICTDTCLLANMSVHMHPSAGYCPVQNQIIASRWMHMNWCRLATIQFFFFPIHSFQSLCLIDPCTHVPSLSPSPQLYTQTHSPSPSLFPLPKHTCFF